MMHIIGFPNKEEHKRAVWALLDVYIPRVGLPGGRMFVTDEHIKALERANIKFKYLSKTGPNEKNSTPVQS